MDSLKTAPPPEVKLHFLDYWRVIRIRKAIIVTVFFLLSVCVYDAFGEEI